MLGAVLLETSKPPRTMKNRYIKKTDFYEKPNFSRFTNRSLVFGPGNKRVMRSPPAQPEPPRTGYGSPNTLSRTLQHYSCHGTCKWGPILDYMALGHLMLYSVTSGNNHDFRLFFVVFWRNWLIGVPRLPIGVP